MWAALLTVATLSLLISSALAAIATYLYFFGSADTAQKRLPSIVPDEAVPFDMDERDISPHKAPEFFSKEPRKKNGPRSRRRQNKSAHM
jgi:hypothetical protein